MRPSRSVALLCLSALVACGGRTPTAFEPPRGDAGASDALLLDASRLDAGSDAPTRDGGHDGGSDAGTDAGSRPDAGPLVCPPADATFQVLALGVIEGTMGQTVGSLGGDGTALYMTVSEGGEATRVLRLEGESASARELARWVATNRARVAVSEGVGRVISFESGRLALHELRGDAVIDRGRMDIDHGSRMEPLPPAWNGAETIVMGSGIYFGPFVAGGLERPWLTGASTDQMHADPVTGITETVAWRGEDRWSLLAFDRSGAPVGPPEGTTLELPGTWSPRFGRIEDDGLGRPIVLFDARSGWGVYELVVTRYTEAGGAGEVTFRAPISSTSSVDLSTDAIPPHTSGYGGVIATGERLLFHASSDGVTSELLTLPSVGWTAHVAAGPCGWVVAADAEGGIELSLVVPPNAAR